MQTIDLKALSQAFSNSGSGETSARLDMQRLGQRCWQLLITKGVPPQEARELAVVIIRFIYLNIAPSQQQKSLIDRYYHHLSSPELLSLQ